MVSRLLQGIVGIGRFAHRQGQGLGALEGRAVSLDVARGLAAFAVLIGHARGFILVDWNEVPEKHLLDAVFYFATGFGHQAVVVFFVLSGYFIGGAVISSWQERRWSWTRYAVQRLVRLEIVLLPSLLLTAALDWIGGKQTGWVGYDGASYPLLHSGPIPNASAAWDLTTFVGNALFLQTIAVPTFGTNGPLWSLANEFWYYVLFPLGWSAVRATGAARLISAVVFTAIIVWLPQGIILGGAIWLLGVVGYWLVKARWRVAVASVPWLIVSTLAFVAVLAASRKGHWLGSDYFIGLAFAPLMAALAVREWSFGAIKKPIEMLADLSYTLYLCHFPLLALLWFTQLAPRQFSPSVAGYSLFAGFVLLALMYTYVMWWCFERNTDSVRRWILNTFARKK